MLYKALHLGISAFTRLTVSIKLYQKYKSLKKENSLLM